MYFAKRITEIRPLTKANAMSSAAMGAEVQPDLHQFQKKEEADDVMQELKRPTIDQQLTSDHAKDVAASQLHENGSCTTANIASPLKPFEKTVGTWVGMTTHLDPWTGTVLDKHGVKTEIRMNGNKFTKRVTNDWGHGHTEVTESTGEIDHTGWLHMTGDSAMERSATAVGDDAIAFHSRCRGLTQDWQELMRFLSDSSRVSSTMLSEGSTLKKLMFSEEKKCSSECSSPEMK
jgi:hypothetical protein